MNFIKNKLNKSAGTYLILLFLMHLFNSPGLMAQDQPNIVVLLADDLGYGDLSCYGSVRINTPNLDQMASEGLRFAQFYAGSAVCTPSRVSMITGRYPSRYNALRHFNDKEMHLQRDVQTLPKALKAAGYVSKHIGKWHLGGLNEKHVKDRTNSIPGPMEHGFDHYFTMIEDPLYRAPAMREKRLYKDAGKHLLRDEEFLPPMEGHWTDLKTDEAIDFIEDHADGEQPFFLNLWFDAPHAPYEPTPGDAMKAYEDRAKGNDLLYRGMVSRLDYSVGRILDKLKELGLDKNTIVVFTSDNGPSYQGSPGPFKGRKVDFHEGGVRVPGIIWWPGKVRAGETTQHMMHYCDLFPTFMSLAGEGESLKNQYELDGYDQSRFLLEGKDKVEREYTFWEIDTYPHNGNFSVTVDKRPDPVAKEIVRKGDWKLLARDGEPLELFNLAEDPYERWNLMKQYPEMTEELSKALKSFLSEPRMNKPY